MLGRILVFAGFFAPHKGGLENVMQDLLSRFVLSGYQVDLLTCNTERVKSHEIYQGIEVWRIPCWNILHGVYPIPLASPTTIKILIKLFHKKHDVVYTFCRFFTSSLLGLIFSKLKRIPLIHSEFGANHSLTNNTFVNFIGKLYDHTLGTILVKSANALTGNSNATGKFLEHLGGTNIAIICPQCGIDSSIFKRVPSNLKTRLGLDHNSIIITTVTRLIYAKGIQDMIAAFPMIKVNIPQAVLIIVGDGPYKKQLIRAALKINNRNILFLGEKNSHEVSEILNITDVLVNPSYSESFVAAAVIEAGAIGIPSVTTDVGGTLEIMEDGRTALIIKPGDVETLSVKICEIIKNTNLKQKIGNDVQTMIHERYNWDNVFKLYLNIITSLTE